MKKIFLQSEIQKHSELSPGTPDCKLNIHGYANTSAEDRQGDIVLPEAWAKGIDNFRRNPILLLNHDMSKPIGRVEKIKVDKTGIYVDAMISSAAEKLYGTHTLVKDGALKAFSVGFIVKDASYDKKNDVLVINEVELLEISVVSVPANQYSLFSVRKQMGDEERGKLIAQIESRQPVTTTAEMQIEVAVETKAAEAAEVKTNEVETVATQQTETKEVKAETVAKEEDKKEEDPLAQIPFVNLLSADVSKLKNGTFVKFNNDRYQIKKIATKKDSSIQLHKVDIKGSELDKVVNVDATTLAVVNNWDIGSEFDIKLIAMNTGELTDNAKEVIKTSFAKTVKATELDLFNLKSGFTLNSEQQKTLNDSLNLVSISSGDWTETHYQIASKNISLIEELLTLPQHHERDLNLKLHGYKLEEKKMAEQLVGETVEIKTTATPSVEVKAPQVEELVNKAGAALVKAADAEDKGASATELKALTDTVDELKATVGKYKDQISAMQSNKMTYETQKRNDPSEFKKDYANLYLIAKALRTTPETLKGFERFKAVLTSNATVFQQAFSEDLYAELRQRLTVLPAFTRKVEVPSKEFYIPVADEATEDYVAQFPSGVFATSDTDATNVPTTRQAGMKAIKLTPHKFMTMTHIAKDEEEDSLIPLVDFLREAATRRLARGLDKALLRGDGSLTAAIGANNALTAGGGYVSAITGVEQLAFAQSALIVTTGGNNTKFTPAHIAQARIAMGKYALTVGENLALFTTIEGYNYLVTHSEFQTVDKFGSQATYLTGAVGAIYGIPIIITEFLDVAGGATRKLGLLWYKPGFVIGERRAMEVESEYLPKQQVTAMYMSTRLDMKALTTVTASALSSTYSFAAVIATTAS